jgi:hypothetical protein
MQRVEIHSELELIWAAGLFEGEGTVSINKAHKKHRGTLRCMVGSTDIEIVKFFLARWGGHWHEVKASGNKQTAWKWSVAATKAEKFLRKIFPYIYTKRVKEKALLGLEFQSQKIIGRGSHSQKYRERQFEYYTRMKHLNLRGIKQKIHTLREHMA